MDGEQFSFNTPLNAMRFQSQLGKEAKRMYKEGQNVVRLSLARVAKVNYKYNTVDVVTTLHKNSTTKNPTDNGRYSARLPVSFGGRTPEGKPYGSNTLVTVGSLVLLGFLEGSKDAPIVLNIYGDADNQSQLTRTTFNSADESDESIQRELWQLFTLYPSMTYQNTDGNGNKEVTFSGKSFLYITDTDAENDYVQDTGFDYIDLPNSRYANGELIEPKSPNSPTLLYVHQGIYDKHRVTIFLKADGTMRVGSRHLDGKGITFQEMRTDGSYSIVQQKDTPDPEMESEVFSKFEIRANGEVVLQTPDHKFEITKKGVLLNGKPLLASGGGGDIPGFEDLKSELEDVMTTITVINGKIESKISKTTYDESMKDIKDYAEGLVGGVRTEVGDINEALADLDSYIDNAFADGIIEETEAIAIASHINSLNKEKADLDSKYTEISANTFLPQANKDSLLLAKEEYDFEHGELIQVIYVAIEDRKTTPEEKLDVDRAFAEYSSSLAQLSSTFETSIDAIATEKAKQALIDAKDFTTGEIKKVNSSITQLADSISSKVESETFTTAIGNIESTMATKEEAEKITGRIEEVAKNVTYKAEIISTNGTVFKNGAGSTTLFCVVYHGAEDVTATIDASRFRWSRISSDAEADAIWDSKHQGVKSVTVASSEFRSRVTFNCEIASE